MILVPRALLKRIEGAAEAAYPEECCGLLAGKPATGGVGVTRVAPSANVTTGDRRMSFEVDPRVRFDLMRELGDGPERIVGIYHSHPDKAAQPSARDLEMAWEPELIWLITALEDGRATHTAAHALDTLGTSFHEIALRTDGQEK